MFLDAVVGEMDLVILKLGRIQTEGLSAKPRKSFLIQVDLKGLDRRQQHVNPEIKLIASDQQRILDISLHDH